MRPGKARAAPKAAKGEGVAAIKWGAKRRLSIALLALQVLLTPFLVAAVLPEDRLDALYHSYTGGGVEVNGPSILWRKMFGGKSSLTANYYVDAISSASIDAVSSASPYKEKRIEKSVGGDFLLNKTIMSLNYTTSDENDFNAKTASFNLSQDMFGDLTTVSMGYVRGWDQIGKNGDPIFAETANRQSYRIGISQILTRDLVMALNFETVTDEGFLNNPYRSVRYLDATSATGYSFESEVYPRTHTSNAVALHTRYHLPYRASVLGEYRYFTDSWGVRSNNVALGYTHPYRDNWMFDVRYRYYKQGDADFYSDLFPYRQSQNFLARDKELSRFNNQTVGLSISYEIKPKDWAFVDRGSLNLSYDHIRFRYDNFRDITQSGASAGLEPLYHFSADVFQLYLSLWY
ncbi:MAG: DUF3570 domain-containing protein [Gammaproteobacteria bacterium]|nr:DUF3570 domain-containing protein [Gammaproteobacteria bacterium]